MHEEGLWRKENNSQAVWRQVHQPLPGNNNNNGNTAAGFLI